MSADFPMEEECYGEEKMAILAIGATILKMFFVVQGLAMTQIDVMEKTLQAQKPRLNFSTAVTLVSVRELISWDILPTQKTAASIGTVGKGSTPTTPVLEATSTMKQRRFAKPTFTSTAATGSYAMTVTKIASLRLHECREKITLVILNCPLLKHL